MMGKEYKHLRYNLNVTGVVDVIIGAIVIRGNADHKGGEEMAISGINIYSAVILAAIYSKGKITIYISKVSDEYFISTNYSSIPISIEDWIALITIDLRCRYMLILSKPLNNDEFISFAGLYHQRCQ